jgi:hypothetical protein
MKGPFGVADYLWRFESEGKPLLTNPRAAPANLPLAPDFFDSHAPIE